MGHRGLAQGLQWKERVDKRGCRGRLGRPVTDGRGTGRRQVTFSLDDEGILASVTEIQDSTGEGCWRTDEEVSFELESEVMGHTGRKYSADVGWSPRRWCKWGEGHQRSPEYMSLLCDKQGKGYTIRKCPISVERGGKRW